MRTQKKQASRNGDWHTIPDTLWIELWTMFHDELDLDNNGQVDAEELGIALRKAGM